MARFPERSAVLLGNGDGTLQAPALFGTGGTEANAVVAADLNGDGKPDIVVANIYTSAENSGLVGVLLNNSNFNPDSDHYYADVLAESFCLRTNGNVHR